MPNTLMREIVTRRPRLRASRVERRTQCNVCDGQRYIEYIQDIDAVESKGIQTTRTERRNGANNKTNWVIRGEELGHESKEGDPGPRGFVDPGSSEGEGRRAVKQVGERNS